MKWVEPILNILDRKRWNKISVCIIQRIEIAGAIVRVHQDHGIRTLMYATEHDAAEAAQEIRKCVKAYREVFHEVG